MNCVGPPYWSEAYLVGGGSSLLGFDLNRLRGRTVVAINDAMLQLPWATACFSADRTWARSRTQDVSRFDGERYLATGTSEPGAINLVRIREWGLSTEPTAVHVVGSSGYGALNLAFLKRASKIVLLGFDYCVMNKHWYKDYPWATGRMKSEYRSWAEAFTTTLPALLAAGVEVLNASSISLITAFPKISLEAI